MKKTLIVIVVFVALVALYVGSLYSSLDARDQTVTVEWKSVESQYQARFDLMPGLIDASREIMPQEQPVFDELSDARSDYDDAVTSDGKASAADDVEAGLGKLSVSIEKYPDLEFSGAVQDSLAKLQGTEGQIIAEQESYDGDVSSYDAFIRTFPMTLAASVFGFGDRTPFHVIGVSIMSAKASSTFSEATSTSSDSLAP